MNKILFKIAFFIIILKYVFKFHNTKYLVINDKNNTKNDYLKKIYWFIILNKY